MCATGRETANERGYTYRWQQATARFRDEYPLCGMRPGGQRPVMSRCFDEGRVTSVVGKDAFGKPRGQVDHVIPHKGRMELFWDREHNWQSLCRGCGAAKSKAGL